MRFGLQNVSDKQETVFVWETVTWIKNIKKSSLIEKKVGWKIEINVTKQIYGQITYKTKRYIKLLLYRYSCKSNDRLQETWREKKENVTFYILHLFQP